MASKKYDDLSKDELVRLLESRDRRDATRFGLVWEANEIERDKALNQDFVALDLDRELSCPPAADGWKNLIIEGDNFDALRYLRMTFAGRVKCIYIDPPYNTGNKDFVYNDHFVDKEDLWRHSKWCEFMFQRLTLAKDLLHECGAIFVSIDDNEVHTLGLLMQQVFNAGNFIANIVWEKSYTANQTAKFVSDNHDYIIAYARNASAFSMGKLVRSDEQEAKFKNPDSDPRGPWKAENLSAGKFYSAGQFEIVGPTGKRFQPPKGRYWRCNQSQYDRWLQDGRITFGTRGDGRPMLKKFIAEMGTGLTPRTWWPHVEVGSNKQASLELKSILTGETEFFTAPKPVSLIRRILNLASGNDDLILDFFAGSGTTAHAVHNLNKEDGGNRRVILVSSTEATAEEPDKNLCRDVCATRVRRVIEGYGDTPGLGGDFAYLRCRRIAPGRLDDIDHSQVWTALQLTHCPTVSPITDEPILSAGSEEQLLLYVPNFRASHARALLKAVRSSPAVMLYTWQPELIRQRLTAFNHVQVEAVPQALALRFGIRI